MASSTTKDKIEDQTKDNKIEDQTKDDKDNKEDQGKDKKGDDDRGIHLLNEYPHYPCRYYLRDGCQRTTLVNNKRCDMCIVSLA